MSDLTYEALNREVDDEGIYVVTMDQLRKLHNAPRLGEIVAANISQKLLSEGLGHIPTTLPVDRKAEVRVFRNGTRLSRLVAAVDSPSPEGDELLLSVVRDEAADTVARIRELIENVR